MEDGYSVCLNKWALDKDIKNELGLLLIISSLCAKKGYCYASNEYLSKLFKETERNISVKLKKLEKKEYISIKYEKVGCLVKNREIRLIKKSTAVDKNIIRTIDKNIKENNISNINNTSKKEIYKEKRFKKPTIEEIKKYCKERNNNIDAEQFYDFYESKGWLVGKNKMKDWKACVRTWEKRHKTKSVETPEWFDKQFKDEEVDDETKRLIAEIEGT